MYCRKMASNVGNEKLLIHYFQMLLSTGNTSTLFADIVSISERVEQGLKNRKIGKAPTSYDPRKI
uniref:Uncharacterized protein n=1 Tax=Cajanus cajan TaxID=3821 RepID=A0A151RIQ2_CAJCA|nr:hypothetical protein KK1_036129 [Cajanus cajan]